jgi:hypothetical protein
VPVQRKGTEVPVERKGTDVPVERKRTDPLRHRLACWIATACLACMSFGASAQAVPFKAELPVLVTSSGQSLDGFTAKTLLTRAGVSNDYKALAKVADLDKVKTLVIAFGASVKGFGSAGVTADSELVRTRELLAAARDRKIRVIGMHIGGSERRTGLSKEIVELVAPASEWLIVWEDGNADGYFTKLAADRKIPLTVIKQPMESGKVLAAAFK